MLLHYLSRRLVVFVPVALLITVVVFSFNFLVPGDAALFILGENATEEQLTALRKEMGLDKPVATQYLTWLTNMLRGDLGRSIRTNEPVAAALVKRLAPTIQLGIMSMVIGVTLAIPLGVFAATRANSLTDRVVSGFSVAGLAIPNFWFGILLILLFSLKLRWLPPSGYVSPATSLSKNLTLMILPAITLGTSFAAGVARQTRSAMVEVLGQDFVRTARAKGLGERRVLYGHALRNALIPVITVIGLRVSNLLGGSVVVETVFAIPGVGRWTIDALLNKDFLVTQAAVLMMGFFVMATNLVVDLAYGLVDPRIRYQ